jgi:hypothetical protein
VTKSVKVQATSVFDPSVFVEAIMEIIPPSLQRVNLDNNVHNVAPPSMLPEGGRVRLIPD